MISILMISRLWKSHKDFLITMFIKEISEGMTSIKNKQEKKIGGYERRIDGYGK